jgi:hypothetical protein
MKLVSPKPIEICLSILREQVQPLRWYSRIRLITKRTSRVIGRVNDDRTFILECSNDLFSKRFVGHLKKDGNRTQIEARWSIPLGSRIYGFHRHDEEEILRFLRHWLQAEAIAEQPAPGDAQEPRA